MSNFASILAAVNKMKDGGNRSQDNDKENYWKAEQDKAGNAFSIIRFLPSISDDQLPFAKVLDHGFQGDNGKWFIEKCPTTIGKDCPVCEANGPLWTSGREADKEIVRKRKRRTSFISNILVISDPKNPDNEGKIFMFKYGKKIFDKVSEAMQPPEVEIQSGESTPINPFDLKEGANFKLKIRRVEGYANFDKSEFDKPSAVEIDSSKLFDLAQFTDEKTFKSYDDLKTRFLATTGATGGISRTQPIKEEADDDVPFKSDAKSIAAPKSTKTVSIPDDSEDDMAFFRNLANDD
jgi:hypothetical protein